MRTVRYAFLERTHPSSMSNAAKYYQRALATQGEKAETFPVGLRYGARLGGRVKPAFQFLTRSYDRDHLYHAVEPEVAFRGADVVTYHILFPFYDRTQRSMDRLWTSWRYRRAAARARAIVAINPAIQEEIRELLGEGAHRKTHLIRLPLQAPSAGRKERAYDLLWVGGNHPRKGPAKFLEALLKVPGRRKVCFLLHRQPEYTEENSKIDRWLREVRRLHDLDLPEYPVPFARLDELYRSSHAFVNSSYYEGFPIAVFDAYARGTRIVVPEVLNFTKDYGHANGVHYYRYDCRRVLEGGEDPKMVERLAGAIESALSEGDFTPSPEVLRPYSDEFVGRELSGLYRKLG
ncbi:MAG: glycosyltransferase family 4 protein [Euryarchaeota archaeon]|nr:glycosyltransferase family 4 protein [Euryarchaeota archaeon]MDE1835293.1 glycosyltransferase family 4 protein [Euryarchaeota archaeon]MDE1881070.1 glycosyltransferase family 4 protein [Euryarchaeota archaeon]MDE2043589.1 glycosyltransferase family 4 protein [Thermoplasmata archaeon]